MIAKKINFNSFLYCILVVYLLYITDSLLFGLNSLNLVMEIAKLSVLFVSVITFGIYLVKNKFRVEKDFLILLFVVSLIFVSALYNSDTSLRLLLKIGLLVFSFSLSKIVDIRKLIGFYLGSMIVIAFVSILGFFLPSIFIRFSNIYLFTSTFRHEFVTVFLTNVPTNQYMQGRNWGPFWEPGVFQAYLNIALLFLLFNKNYSFFKKIVFSLVLIFAIVTTYSTTGYIVLTFVLLSYIVNYSDFNFRTLGKILFLGFVFLFSLTLFINSNLFQEIILRKFLSTAEQSRFLSYTAGIKLFFSHPILGVGPQSVMDELTTISQYNFALTNTVIAQYVIYGVFVGTYFLYNYKKFVDSLNLSTISTIVLYIAFLAIFSGQNFNLSIFFTTLMFFRVPKSYLSKKCKTFCEQYEKGGAK